jgi:hypothetical protein
MTNRRTKGNPRWVLPTSWVSKLVRESPYQALWSGYMKGGISDSYWYGGKPFAGLAEVLGGP